MKTNANAGFGRFLAPTIFANALRGHVVEVAMIGRAKVLSSGLDCPSRFYYPAHQAGGGAWS